MEKKLNAVFQIVVIGLMNVIELFMVPNLLLFGTFNMVFAVLLMFMIYYNEFCINLIC